MGKHFVLSYFKSELLEQSELLMEKTNELKLELEQVYDKLRSRIGNVSRLFDYFRLISIFFLFFHPQNLLFNKKINLPLDVVIFSVNIRRLQIHRNTQNAQEHRR